MFVVIVGRQWSDQILITLFSLIDFSLPQIVLNEILFFFLHQWQLPNNEGSISQCIRRHGVCEMLGLGYMSAAARILIEQAYIFTCAADACSPVHTRRSFTLIYLYTHTSATYSADKCRQKDNHTHCKHWMAAISYVMPSKSTRQRIWCYSFFVLPQN